MSAKEIYLSLGSNQGDSLDNLLQAIISLAGSGIAIDCISSIYQTEPVGFTDQGDFLNLVIKGVTSLSPIELLQICQAIERQLKRVRTQRWGPRTMDIDILFYGTDQIKTAELTVPHPRLHERAFVLVPLREIARDKYQQLGVSIPDQKICLLIDKFDVKIMLKKRGMQLRTL